VVHLSDYVMVDCCNHHGLGTLLFGWLDILLLWSTQWGGSGEHVVVKGSLGDGDEGVSNFVMVMAIEKCALVTRLQQPKG
jgi:hypothetical protein